MAEQSLVLVHEHPRFRLMLGETALTIEFAEFVDTDVGVSDWFSLA